MNEKTMKERYFKGGMKPKKSIIEQVSIDCVIFGFHENQLKILLLKFKGVEAWALPGGFVFHDESMDDAAHRILEDRTGIKDIYLEQFHVFGDNNRQFKKLHEEVMTINGIATEENHWLFQRFISIGFYALMDFSKVKPTIDDYADICDWYDIEAMPNLSFDHPQIFQKALETLRSNLNTKLVGFNLLPETFTMGELQSLHETILGKKLIRTNFQRKILSLDILERIEKKYTGGSHKAPYLYRLDTAKDEEYLKENF
jgi:8-oxo-dGTP diphosphatase